MRNINGPCAYQITVRIEYPNKIRTFRQVTYNGFEIEKTGTFASLTNVFLPKIESGAGANNVYFYSGTTVVQNVVLGDENRITVRAQNRGAALDNSSCLDFRAILATALKGFIMNPRRLSNRTFCFTAN
ncbi:MAG: hypothetical protein ABII96_07350 [Candidatus Zixiibacteriota bacterium]